MKLYIQVMAEAGIGQPLWPIGAPLQLASSEHRGINDVALMTKLNASGQTP
jgi:hypothetical protein